ncbi:hypothetical protein AB1Y20_020178 [Prymnesium parvum]|uniref:Uncharacterized protein n=1 Tax=Prymnesium parvum TaxID=97485 RepID=A0AB34JWV2_PRYPA
MMLAFALLVPPVASQCGRGIAVDIDFSNPAVSMEWRNANGARFNGTLIPYGSTDSTTGALPRGEVRWRNIGFYENASFDLLVTTPTATVDYGTLIAEYRTPISNSATQATFTSAGYACLGFGVRRSICASGSLPDSNTAFCADGSQVTLRGAEFDFKFVEAGTSSQLPPLTSSFVTFYDVDGDRISGNSVFEFVSILSSSSPRPHLLPMPAMWRKHLFCAKRVPSLVDYTSTFHSIRCLASFRAQTTKTPVACPPTAAVSSVFPSANTTSPFAELPTLSPLQLATTSSSSASLTTVHTSAATATSITFAAKLPTTGTSTAKTASD